MPGRESRTAAWAVWLIVTVLAGGACLAAWAAPEVAGELAPVCESKARYNKECALCGMTRAFVHIARGEFREAYALNRGSVALYAAFLANLALAALVAAARARRRIRAGSGNKG